MRLLGISMVVGSDRTRGGAIGWVLGMALKCPNQTHAGIFVPAFVRHHGCHLLRGLPACYGARWSRLDKALIIEGMALPIGVVFLAALSFRWNDHRFPSEKSES